MKGSGWESGKNIVLKVYEMEKKLTIRIIYNDIS
jgi:hypothetical protein